LVLLDRSWIRTSEKPIINPLPPPPKKTEP
jgi:hypothetical protein